MKFIAIGDIHLALYSQDPINHESDLSQRLHSMKTVMYNITEYATSNNINNIVIAGDTNHTKSIIHAVAQGVLLDWIRNYNGRLNFYIIDGNHDMSSKSGKGVSALKCLDAEPNVHMFHETEQIDNVLFVPWGLTMLDDIKNGEAEYLVAHLGVNEAQLSNGISIVSEIGMKDLRQYKTCILGHYHKPQEFKNIFYTGSLIQLDRGERNEEKRFLVVDTDNHIITSHPTEGYMKYFDLEINNENRDEIIAEAKVLQEEGHFVNISIVEKGVDLSDIGEGFRVVDRTEIDINDRGIDSTMSTEDILNKYLEIKEVPDNERELYGGVAKRLISECSEIQ